MKTAKAIAFVLDVYCPYCKEPVVDPTTGSYQITAESFPQNVVTCSECGKQSKMPTKAFLG